MVVHEHVNIHILLSLLWDCVIFFGVVRFEDVWCGVVWGGGGGPMFQEVGVCMGFQRGAG